MKVSVVIPVYNKAAFIERSINSVLAQSFSDFELILVDDGSTDESFKIAKKFKDSRIRFLQQPNSGPGAARNLGIRSSNGELVAFLDADDEWLPDYLRESIYLLGLHPCSSAVVSGYLEYPRAVSTEEMWRKRGIKNAVVKIGPEDPPMQIVHMLAYMSSWSTVSRKETLLRWGGFYSEERCTYAEDAFLWLKLLLNEHVLFNTNPLVKFHREASELSNHTRGPHPVEPFLKKPELMRSNCPPKLAGLLEKILAIRAFKTACVLGFWGDWKQAANLFKSFARVRYWNLPYFFPALVCSTSIGASLGSGYRYLGEITRKGSGRRGNFSQLEKAARSAL